MDIHAEMTKQQQSKALRNKKRREARRKKRKKLKELKTTTATTTNSSEIDFEESKPDWSSLPLELWSHIFTFAKFPLNCSLVNSEWNELYRQRFHYVECKLSFTQCCYLNVIRSKCIDNKRSSSRIDRIRAGLTRLIKEGKRTPKSIFPNAKVRMKAFLLFLCHNMGDLAMTILQQDPASIDCSMKDNAAVIAASVSKVPGLLEMILKDTRVNPNAHGRLALLNAISHPSFSSKDLSCEENVVVFLKHPMVDAFKVNEQLGESYIKLIIDMKMAEAVRVVLLDPRMLEYNGGLELNRLREYIDYCLLNNNVDVLKVLMEHPTVIDDQHLKNKLLANSLSGKQNRMEFIRFLLSIRAQPSCLTDRDLRRIRFPEALELLLRDDRLDPAMNNNSTLRHFILNNDEACYEVLVKDPRVVVTSDVIFDVIDEFFGRTKARSEFLVFSDSMVRVVRDFPALNYSFYNSRLFRMACEVNHVDLVQALLDSSNVRPDALGNYGFRMACEKGHLEIVRLLLRDGRVNVSAHNDEAFRKACHGGHIEIVELLLAQPGVDPSNEGNIGFIHACQNGHAKIVELLLKDSRVDPVDDNNQALKRAALFRRDEVVRLLLSDPRIDPSGDNAIMSFKPTERKEKLA